MNEISIVKHENGIKVVRFPALDAVEGVQALFTTRVGGASKGVYAESNFSYTRGDEKEAVDENYRLAVEALSDERTADAAPLTPDACVLTYQTHTTNVMQVTHEDCGKGVTRERGYTDIDGLITNERGVILVTLHADCTPLYFVDPKHNAIGLAHSGWRGTAGGIGSEVVQKMQQAFDTRAEDLICIIGPAICETHYEVGEDVHEAFRTHYGTDCETYRLFTPSPIVQGKYFFSLERANRMVLERAGVPAANIHESHLCTACETDLFYSHRRDGEKRGNMAAMLTLVHKG